MDPYQYTRSTTKPTGGSGYVDQGKISSLAAKYRMEDPSTGSPISQSDSSPSKAGVWPRPEADQLKAKSETTLYQDPGKDQPYPTKSVPNLDGIGTPDEQKMRSYPKYDHYRSPSQDQRLPSESQQPRSSSYERHMESFGDYGRIYPESSRDNYGEYRTGPPKPERTHAAFSNQMYMDHQEIARENPPGREVYSQDSGYPSSLERSRGQAEKRNSAFESYKKPGLTPQRDNDRILHRRDGSMDTEENHTVVATARGVYDSNGGVLESKDTGVSIIIPKSAIPEGVQQEIYFKVCQDNSILPPLDKEKGETLLSPLVMCGPHGLKFLQPVELRLPHCASVNPDSWSFALKSSDSPTANTTAGQPTQWQNMTLAGLDGVSQGRVGKSSVSVLVDHF